METKYITIPFDVERAKRITNGVEPGKIVTRDGRNVRIIFWEVKNIETIIALVEDDNGFEWPFSFLDNGSYNIGKSCDNDLMLSVPEWTTFKDGDIVTMGWESGDHYCKWISIIKVIDVFDGDICTRDYVALCIEADDINSFSIEFDCESDAAKWIRTSTEEEIYKLIEDLKKSKDPKAKEYLKRFFPEHCDYGKIVNEHKLNPKDWVLTRENCEDKWKLDIFSHAEWEESEQCYHYYCVGGWEYECIPYEGNEELLGTNKGLEDKK